MQRNAADQGRRRDVAARRRHVQHGAREIGDPGGSPDSPTRLLTHLHTVNTEHSEHLPTLCEPWLQRESALHPRSGIEVPIYAPEPEPEPEPVAVVRRDIIAAPPGLCCAGRIADEGYTRGARGSDRAARVCQSPARKRDPNRKPKKDAAEMMRCARPPLARTERAQPGLGTLQGARYM